MTNRRSRRAYADTSLGQIHYREAGDLDAPAVVLLHQSPSSGAMWEPVLPALAERGYLALAPDLLGYGNSDPAPYSPPMLADYAAGVWAFMDAVGVRQAALVGHHAGASIAVLMAASSQERIVALALWGVPLLSPERYEQLAREQPPDWTSPDWFVPRWERRRSASGAAWRPEIQLRAMREYLEAAPYAHLLHNAVGQVPLQPLLPMVSQPLLAMAGPGDRLNDAGREAARLAPQGRFLELPAGGMDVADQQTAAFVNAICSFLASTDWMLQASHAEQVKAQLPREHRLDRAVTSRAVIPTTC